jgi:hypothetical protein
MGFKNNILLYILVPLLILLVASSYVRFFVTHDYRVAYEGECDPYEEDCFIGCDDEECTTEYYYTKVQKHAATVFAQCGEDITDCAAASVCLPEDTLVCDITYCNSGTEEEGACETLSSSPDVLDSVQVELDTDKAQKSTGEELTL